MTVRIKNKFGEEIDTLVEGNDGANTTVVFVHGMGTNKHETGGLLDDLAAVLFDRFRVVRFDFTGFGQSDGRQEDVDYKKEAGDLTAVLEWVRQNFTGKIYILAQSMGGFVTCLLSPDGIEKTILLGLPNTSTDYIVNRVKVRILSRAGGIFNEQGVSVFPRSSGEVQKYGPIFWKTLREFEPVKFVSQMAAKTKLFVIHSRQDEIVGNEYLEEYKSIQGLAYIEVDGNHSFLDPLQRQVMIEKVKSIFEREFND